MSVALTRDKNKEVFFYIPLKNLIEEKTHTIEVLQELFESLRSAGRRFTPTPESAEGGNRLSQHLLLQNAEKRLPCILLPPRIVSAPGEKVLTQGDAEMFQRRRDTCRGMRIVFSLNQDDRTADFWKNIQQPAGFPETGDFRPEGAVGSAVRRKAFWLLNL